MSAPADYSVYLVTDTAQCLAVGRGVLDTVLAAVSGGATAVQLREKDASAREFLALTIAVAGALPEGVTLFVNDRVDVFLAARAAGVRVGGMHVGQSDLPVSSVRALIGPDALLGLSAASDAQLLAAAADPAGVDYVGIGPLHATRTKRDAPAGIGIDEFARLCAVSPLPAVAIGGVTAADLAGVRAAGGVGAAVVSAICASADPERSTAELARAWAAGPTPR